MIRRRGLRTLKFIFYCWAIMAGFAATAQASVLDAPHNMTNGISCASCHTYSFWWQYSPAKLDPQFVSNVDRLCTKCHKVGGTGPMVVTHSSLHTQSARPTWERGCTACHSPHNQDQLDWAVANDLGPYLVTGTITGVTTPYDSATNETTISYADPINNAALPTWPAEGAAPTDRDWANKSVANPGRGLILVQDKTKKTSTFSIVATNVTVEGVTEVTVKGEITDTMIDPTYTDPVSHAQNSTTCDTFGLIYGNLIRSAIKVDGTNKSVKFFDPQGGAISREENGNPTGVCQVCHTDTTHYNKNGTLPNEADTHTGRNDANCIVCHKHIEGFKGLGHEVADFGWGSSNCAICHNPSGIAVNIVDVIHKGKCGTCHVSTGGGDTLREGDPAFGIDGSAVDATRASTCVDCHTPLARTIHHVSAHDYAADGECTQCHADGSGRLVAPHDTLVTDAVECSSCHTATAGQATGIPVSTGDNRVHDACLTCHDTAGDLQAPYGKAEAMPQSGGSCTTCHGAYFPNHNSVNNHNAFLLKTGTACESCHNQSGNPATDVMSTIHQGVCGKCHDAITHGLINGITPGVKSGGVTYMIGDARKHSLGSQSACTVCHGQNIHTNMTTKATHPEINRTHDPNVAVDAACLGMCHVAEVPPFTGGEEVHWRECYTCHNTGNYDYRLKGSALNHTVGQPSTCTGCHLLTGANKRHDLSGVAVTTTPAIVAGYVTNSFTLTTDFTSNDTSDIVSCMATTDGTTWTAGVVSGANPTFTCTATYTALVDGPVVLNMKASTAAGNVIVADAVAATVSGGPTDGAALTVTPGAGQITLSWDAAIDNGFGLRASTTYDVRWLADGTTPPTCTTGTSIYLGTNTSFVHASDLTVGVQANYRVCAYDTQDQASAGLTGAGTISE